MNTIAIRGAITVEENSIAAIAEATIELYEAVISANSVTENDIVQIIFSITKDLTKIYPAKALREKFGLKDTPLFCVQEADIEGSLKKCIRMLITVKSPLSKSEVKHVYLKNAQNLRPDLN